MPNSEITTVIKILGLPLLKIKQYDNKKRIYLFGFLPLLKKEQKGYTHRYYLFGFLRVWKRVDVKGLMHDYVCIQNENNNLLQQNSELHTQNTELHTQNTELHTQNDNLSQSDFCKSYSQCGEDAIIYFIMFYFTNMDTSNLRYLDIGSNYPINGNNTYRFYRYGARGVLVEPNKELCLLSEQDRPEDLVINAGIKFSDADEATYYALSECGLNTFDKQSADYAISMGHTLVDTYTMPLISINHIIAQNFVDNKLDIISIDAEGVSMEVLESIDFSLCRPSIVCIESNKESLDYGYPHSIIEFMKRKGYLLMADSSINFIFLDENKYVKGKYC